MLAFFGVAVSRWSRFGEVRPVDQRERAGSGIVNRALARPAASGRRISPRTPSGHPTRWCRARVRRPPRRGRRRSGCRTGRQRELLVRERDRLRGGGRRAAGAAVNEDGRAGGVRGGRQGDRGGAEQGGGSDGTAVHAHGPSSWLACSCRMRALTGRGGARKTSRTVGRGARCRARGSDPIRRCPAGRHAAAEHGRCRSAVEPRPTSWRTAADRLPWRERPGATGRVDAGGTDTRLPPRPVRVGAGGRGPLPSRPAGRAAIPPLPGATAP